MWISILESSNFNNSRIQDKWHCWKSSAQSERRQRRVFNSTELQKQSMHASWRFMSPRDNVWIMQITSKAKEIIRWHTATWFRSLFLCLKRWTFWMRKQQSTRNGRSSNRFQRYSWTKLGAKKEGYSGGAKRQKDRPLCYIDGHLSSPKRAVRTNISEV